MLVPQVCFCLDHALEMIHALQSPDGASRDDPRGRYAKLGTGLFLQREQIPISGVAIRIVGWVDGKPDHGLFRR